MKINIVNKSKHPLPAYSTEASAGIDIRANIDTDIILVPGERSLVKKGLLVEILVGYKAQVRPGSGLAINKGITVLISPGTIDSDFRDEICYGM